MREKFLDFIFGAQHLVSYCASFENTDKENKISTDLYEHTTMRAKSKAAAQSSLQRTYGKNAVVKVLSFVKK